MPLISNCSCCYKEYGILEAKCGHLFCQKCMLGIVKFNTAVCPIDEQCVSKLFVGKDFFAKTAENPKPKELTSDETTDAEKVLETKNVGAKVKEASQFVAESIAAIGKKVMSLEEEVNEFDKAVYRRTMMSEVIKLRYDLDDIITKLTKLEEKQSITNNRDKEINDRIDNLSTDITQLSIQTRTCIYIWKLEKYEELAKEIHTGHHKMSNQFQSHPFGYRMCLYFYPNGYKENPAATACYVKIMKGPWDSILKWPVEYEGTISLIARNDVENDYVKKIKSNSLKENIFSRPISEGNILWGFQEFIGRDRLKLLYLRENSVFIKLELVFKI